MFQVSEIAEDAKKTIGVCDDAKMFRWLSEAVGLLANKADLEGFKGTIDICSCGCSCCGNKCVTLPREVETVLAVNIGGRPSLGYGQLFSFHLNGMGDACVPCNYSWEDLGQFHSTHQDLRCPAKLVAYVASAEDNGKQLIVFGYDKFGNVLRRNEGGTWHNGYAIPTIYGYAVPDSEAPEVARITGIFKEDTVGSVRLSTIDESGNTGTLLGLYEHDERTPQYRRIRLNKAASWVRIAYMRVNPIFTSRADHVPLKSRTALILALQARKYYFEGRLAEANMLEANASRLENEAQSKCEAPLFNPIQVVNINGLKDGCDMEIV